MKANWHPRAERVPNVLADEGLSLPAVDSALDLLGLTHAVPRWVWVEGMIICGLAGHLDFGAERSASAAARSSIRCMPLLEAHSILLSTNRVLPHDRGALPDNVRQVALVDLKLEPVRLSEVVGRDLHQGAHVADAICSLK